MKKKFVVDEDVFVHAIREVDSHDLPDPTSAIFFRELGKNCHKIILEQRLINKYHQKIKLLQREKEKFPIPNFEFVFRQIFLNQEKIIFLKGIIEPLEDETDLPRKDLFLIENSVASSAPIVSNDTPLKNAIEAKENLEVTIHTPAQAIPLVSQE